MVRSSKILLRASNYLVEMRKLHKPVTLGVSFAHTIDSKFLSHKPVTVVVIR